MFTTPQQLADARAKAAEMIETIEKLKGSPYATVVKAAANSCGSVELVNTYVTHVVTDHGCSALLGRQLLDHIAHSFTDVLSKLAEASGLSEEVFTEAVDAGAKIHRACNATVAHNHGPAKDDPAHKDPEN